MDFEQLVPRDPLEVTLPYAYQLTFDRRFDELRHSDKETETIREVNLFLEHLDMIGNYEVKTSLGFVLPDDIINEPDSKVLIHRMDLDMEFKGGLVGSRTLKIGRIIGDNAIRAVCLAFQDVEIQRLKLDEGVIPLHHHIEEEERMYVPVFAVRGISHATQ